MIVVESGRNAESDLSDEASESEDIEELSRLAAEMALSTYNISHHRHKSTKMNDDDDDDDDDEDSRDQLEYDDFERYATPGFHRPASPTLIDALIQKGVGPLEREQELVDDARDHDEAAIAMMSDHLAARRRALRRGHDMPPLVDRRSREPAAARCRPFVGLSRHAKHAVWHARRRCAARRHVDRPEIDDEPVQQRASMCCVSICCENLLNFCVFFCEFSWFFSRTTFTTTTIA